jgi:hypothetical protein
MSRPVSLHPAGSWEDVQLRLKVVRMSPLVLLAVPVLDLSGAGKSTRGVSFYPGAAGAALGVALVATSVAVALILGGPVGLFVGLVLFWLLGSGGIVMAYSAVRPLAFIKPICTRCRLLPIISEHESIHLAGTAGEADVWDSMKRRHSVQSLRLEGDPSICSFCPIPKRLAGK